MPDCPSEDQLLRFVERQLPAAEAESVETHLADCPSCAVLVADALRTRPDAEPLGAGARLERYMILQLIGRGAMGVVYAAYDPQLDRRIALKLLHPDAAADRAELQQRFLREAQSMARLAHPNVVAVHDVGLLDGEVFLAMEFVDGETLSQWLQSQPRTASEILAAFVQAAHGLAGAHRAGIVHRDFKPDNVLVGRDGRVRVTDFGLARRDDATGARAAGAAPTAVGATVDGALLGTPAFMAPEQLRGERAGAASDQFAFSAALYRALFGQGPFADDGNFAALREAVLRGVVRKPKSLAGVPAHVTRALWRGLALEAGARFADMDQLIAALTRDPRRRVVPALAIAATVAMAIGGATLALNARRHVCTGAEAAWGDTSSLARLEAVRASFRASGRAWADDTFARVLATLAQYRREWLEMHQGACQATRVRGEQSEAQLDVRMACLKERQHEAATLIELFGEASPELVDRAATVVEGLPAVAECANPQLLRAASLPSAPAARARVAELTDQLARTRTLVATGRYKEARELADRSLEATLAIGWRPLAPKLLLQRGRAGARSANPATERDLNEAAALALEVGDDATAADAWLSLIREVGFERNQPAEAEPFARYAEAAIRRLSDDGREAGRLLEVAAIRWLREGRYDEAEALVARASELLRRSSHGEASLFSIRALGMQAGLLDSMGRNAQALPLFHQASVETERLLGSHHPELSSTWANEAEALDRAGRSDEALALYQRARGLLAENHPNVQYLDHRIAATLRRRGDFAAALAADRRSIDEIARVFHGQASYLDRPLTGEGLDLLGLHRAREAIAPLEHALATQENKAPPWELAETRFGLARALKDGGGDRDRARSLATSAADLLKPLAQRWGAQYASALQEVQIWLKDFR
jgi:serine/threonine protein kinase